MFLYPTKFEYSLETAKFISQCAAYYWEEEDEDGDVDLRVFQALNRIKVDKLYRKYPILCMDPINFYLYGCELFGDYTPEQRDLVAQSDASIWRYTYKYLSGWLMWSLHQPLYKYILNNIKCRLLDLQLQFRLIF